MRSGYGSRHSSKTTRSGRCKSNSPDPLLNVLDVGVNQLYLTGRGDRSFFDVRGIHYYGFSQFDIQGQLPVIHPVMDYTYTFDQPVFGGELGYSTNLISLTRSSADFNPISQSAFNNNYCAFNNGQMNVITGPATPPTRRSRLRRTACSAASRETIRAGRRRSIGANNLSTRSDRSSYRSCRYAGMPLRHKSKMSRGSEISLNPATPTVARGMPTLGLSTAIRLSGFKDGAHKPSNRSVKLYSAPTKPRSPSCRTKTPKA